MVCFVSEQIARAIVDIAGRAPNLTILERTVNGQLGLVGQQDGVTVTVFAFDVAGDPDHVHLGSTQPRTAPALDDRLTRVFCTHGSRRQSRWGVSASGSCNRTGSRTRRTVSPGWESIVIVPRWRSTTMRRAMSRPRPVP
jgi:hypothetical protein